MDEIKSGCIVFHGPLGEEVLVLGRSGNKLCLAGWPPSIVNVEDCIYLDQRSLSDDEIEYRREQFGLGWE